MRVLSVILCLAACSAPAAAPVADAKSAAAPDSATDSAPASDTAADSGAPDVRQTPPPAADLQRDLLHTALQVDLATKTATATVTFAESKSAGASLEVAGLQISEVRDALGPLQFKVADGQLDIGVPALPGPSTVTIAYAFSEQKKFQGLMAAGSTLVFPYYCGNLFPCHSNPADGMTFALQVAGAPAGQAAVFPAAVAVQVPSYVLAWATAAYQTLELGTTAGGVHLVASHTAAKAAAAKKGTAHLKQLFEWYETTLGPYTLGQEAGPVQVDWGPTAYGGMEHHPRWHVADIALGDETVQAHEIAHGWYGDGVRIACWEDFVLSEGVVSYLEARAAEAVLGAAAADGVWQEYDLRLKAYMAVSTHLQDAWPQSCGQVDLLKSGLFSDLPYMKGAYFFKALQGKIGAPAVDAALKSFYAKRKGTAAKFAELLAEVKAGSGYDPQACAEAWLRGKTVPAEAACP